MRQCFVIRYAKRHWIEILENIFVVCFEHRFVLIILRKLKPLLLEKSLNFKCYVTPRTLCQYICVVSMTLHLSILHFLLWNNRIFYSFWRLGKVKRAGSYHYRRMIKHIFILHITLLILINIFSQWKQP